jgi:hypothetical protein
MKQQHLNLALELIAKSNSPKVSFNVPINDSYSNVYDILIHESNATLIDQLIKNGFSLHMTKKGLSINNYSI